MNLIEMIKLNDRQKAIGTILIFPWYLYFSPVIGKFVIKLFTIFVSSNVSADSLNAYFNVFIGLSTAILLIWVFKDFILKNIRIFKENLLENIIWVLTIGILMTYLFSFAGEFVVNLLLPSGNREASNQDIVQTLISSNFLLMAFQSVIIAPIVEELLFRGLIFNSIRQKNVLWAHLISAFLFGLLHVYSYILAGDMSEWIKLIPYMTAGLAFSITYEKRQNIVAPMMLHATKNLIAVLIVFLIA